jgi:putative nucleotidyltransferase with HDIG domain
VISIHVIADRRDKLSALRLRLPKLGASFALLGEDARTATLLDAVIIAADIRVIDNITALKQAMRTFADVRKRIFLIDGKSHLHCAQAYALGATRVLSNQVSGQELLGHLFDEVALSTSSATAVVETTRAAAAAASRLTSAFTAVACGRAVDVLGVVEAADGIAESVMDHGLTNWLSIVRRHHEGTYQHCLLVTGIAVDFGLSLGLSPADIRRLSTAATFHDIGKARVPFALLNKPGKLDPDERALIETHAVSGYDVLKGASVASEVLDAVRHHHEYLDGSGYPDGLSGQRIPDIVRLLTIADIFGALIEDRRYKPCMPRDEAYNVLLSMGGKLEMPLVAAFRQVALGH